MTHVLVVVAQQYNANELWPMLKELKAGGHTWSTTAYRPIIIDERSRKGYRVTRLLNTIDGVIEDYGGVVFVSGNPKDTMAHWKDNVCNMIVRIAANVCYPLAGICSSVPSLGPVLEGVKVSAFPLNSVREALIEAGALLQPVSIYTDRNIATAENEAMARMWARNFRCLLENRPPEYSLQPSPFKLPKRQLRSIPEVEFLRRQNDNIPSK